MLRLRDDRYRSANPVGDDVLLLIEVADAGLTLEGTVKLAKYARAGIQRCWLADLILRKTSMQLLHGSAAEPP